MRTVLGKYAFSDAEKQVIHAAIITAKKDRPNMTLISKADALLKEVAQSREPLPTNDNSIEAKKVHAALELARHTSFQKKNEGRMPAGVRNWVLSVFVGAIGALVFQFYMDHHTPLKIKYANGAEVEEGLYSFSEAKVLCRQKGKKLPLTLDEAVDILSMPTERNAEGFWSEKGEILYNIAQGWKNDDGKKHHVVCVDKNGKSLSNYVVTSSV